MATKSKASPATETSAPAAAATKITPLKKITVKAVMGRVKASDIPEDGELPLCRIAGIATATETGESTYGQWTALAGEFAATNYQTGEIFVGKTAFVPGAMGDALYDALNKAQREDAGASLKFSVDVSVVPSPKDDEKYEYRVRPVLENDVANRAVALLSL